MTDEQLRREADLFLARSRQAVKDSRARQQHVERAVAESMRSIRRALLELRRGH